MIQNPENRIDQLLLDADLIQHINTEESIKLLQEALAELPERGAENEQARILHEHLGELYFRNFRYRDAIRVWQTAADIYSKLQNTELTAILFNKIGVLLKRLSEYSDALELFQRSLKLSRNCGDTETEAKAQNNIGLVYKNLWQFDRALNAFQKSLEIKQQHGNLLGAANTMINIANIHKERQSYGQSIEFLTHSRSMLNNIKTQQQISGAAVNRALAAIAHDLGNNYLCTGDYQTAIQRYSESLRLNQETGSTSRLFADYRDIGDVYSLLENEESAERFLVQALQLAQKTGMEDYTYKAHVSLGRLKSRQGNDEGAADHFATAIDVLEKIRSNLLIDMHQTGFISSVAEIYDLAITTCVRLGRNQDVFRIFEKMKARTLLDIIIRGDIDLAHIMTSDDLETERRLKVDLANLNHALASLKISQQSEFEKLARQRDQLRLELNEFEENLYLRHPELKEMRGLSEAIDIRKARLLMSRDEAALYYLMLPDRLIIMVLSRSILEVAETNISKNRIEKLISSIIRKTSEWNREAAQDLYEILISPILEFIQERRRLCIIPDGKLNFLPFQALISPDTGRYLIEDYSIYYTPSLTTLNIVRSIGNYGTGTLLGFGDPDFSGDEQQKRGWRDRLMPLTPLPATRSELEGIQSVYESRAQILMQEEATKTRFMEMAGDYGILHFATHAFTDEEFPMYSAIALSQENGVFGFLEARDIIRMELNADLVVLSACKTAAGKYVAGEGMLGLTRAFFTAGVPTVVASLWNVDDKSTKELMIRFHRSFHQRERSASALREAQLSLLNDPEYSDPYYWAPFILIGDSE